MLNIAGMSDVHALPLAVSTYQACHFIGLPECAVCIMSANHRSVYW